MGRKASPVTDAMPAQLAGSIVRRRHQVEAIRANNGITVVDRRTGASVARLTPVPGTDRYTVRWWSDVRGRWMPADALGDIRLTLEEAGPSIAEDSVFWLSVER
jgi:hypothetical protein